MNVKELKEKISKYFSDDDFVETILMYYFKCDRDQIPLETEEDIANDVLVKAKQCLDRPIQYVFNEAPFYDLSLYVDERVLIPRFDTEILVGRVIKDIGASDDVLDLCTGSGAIAVTIKTHTEANVYASDISEDALCVAKMNAKKYDLDIEFIVSDLLKNVNHTFDKIVSNPPYITKGEMEVLDKKVLLEPRLALFGGDDGLDFYREISRTAKSKLNLGGKIYFEIGYKQARDVSQILKSNGYKDIEILKDYGGNDRVVIATNGDSI